MTTTSPKFVYLMLLTLLFSSIGVAQNKTAKLTKADKEYDKYSYIDAQQVYLQVVEEGFKSAQIYQKLGNTYYFNSDYKDAAKWYQLLINEFEEETPVAYYYRYAQSLKSMGNYDKSDTIMALYVEKGGDTKIAKNFNDPNYLERISEGAIDYELATTSINTDNSDFGPTYFGDKVVFASASDTIIDKKLAVHEWNNQPFLDLYMADVTEEGDLVNMQRLEGDVNSKYHESSSTFSKDGRTMYFTRNNYIDGKKGRDKDKTILLKIYKATLSGDNYWTNIKELPFNSDEYSTAHPALSLDGKRLYFASDMPEGVGQSDIWYVNILDDNMYSNPVNLKSINTEARESFPFISQGNNMYFSSDGRAGLGGLDVYMTPLDAKGMPTDIKNLGAPTNSEKDDFGFIYNEEKKIGYVSSNRGGEAGFVNDDIYVVKECEIILTGAVTDRKTGELLPGARVQLLDADNNPIGDAIIVGDNAVYSFIVPCKERFILRADKKDYETEEVFVDTPGVTGELVVPISLVGVPCPSYDLGCKVNLQPIYFDLDRYNIREDAANELAKILIAMRQYPELIIHIESHTDSRATKRYNEILSERRAQSTMDWLIERGIDKSRLSAKGYGETQLVNGCEDNVDCTEELHQQNRRSMFIIKN